MKIIITGAKHSGKTTVGMAIASAFNISFVDTDDLIVSLYSQKAGGAVAVREIYKTIGSEAFRELEREAVAEASRYDYRVIATGGGAILEGESRTRLFADSIVVHLMADESLLWSRIEANGIPPFYEGTDGRKNHIARVELINEIMVPRADIVQRITADNESSAAEELADKIESAVECMMRSPSTLGEIVRVTTFGESHGKGLGAVIDGIRPGLEISESDIQHELDRRRPGQSNVATPRDEKDRVKILSGVFEGKTTGHPICMVVFNEDQDSSKYDNLRNVFRPGHADFTFWKKYGIRDHRGGGRSSGRETIGRVATGAVAKKILSAKGITVTAFAEEIAGIRGVSEDLSIIESNPVRAADADAAVLMERAVIEAKEQHESVGGVVKLIVRGVPACLGDPVFNKLDSRLASALFSIGAVKGVEFGAGFLSARLTGSQNNDPMNRSGFDSNNSGGILGGISTGEEIVIRIAVKPTPSIFKPQKTIDSRGCETVIEIKGRHDPCIVPRIIPVVESMAALVLLDAFEVNERLAAANESF